MSDVTTLAAEARAEAGKGPARAIRRGGRVPAIIYGDKKDPTAISVEALDLGHELNRPGFFRRLYSIEVDGRKQQVLPRDVQRHPVTDAPLHVDFLRIGAGDSIAVNVAVIFVNEDESPGLTRGGVINIVRHEIELMCPATAIPDAIRIDLTGLDIGDSVHISGIDLPADVTPTITDRDFTICTIAAPTVVVEEVAEEEEDLEGEEGEEGVEGEEGEEGAEGEAKAKPNEDEG